MQAENEKQLKKRQELFGSPGPEGDRSRARGFRESLNTGANVAGGAAAAIAVGVAVLYIVGTATKLSQLNVSGVSRSLALPFISNGELLHAGIAKSFDAVLFGLILFMISPVLVWATRVTGIAAAWQDDYAKSDQIREDSGAFKQVFGWLVFIAVFASFVALMFIAEDYFVSAASVTMLVVILVPGSAWVRLFSAITAGILVLAFLSALHADGPLPIIEISQRCGLTSGGLIGSDENYWYVNAPTQSAGSSCPVGTIVPIRMATSSSPVIYAGSAPTGATGSASGR